jgi:hypothetical protein
MAVHPEIIVHHARRFSSASPVFECHDVELFQRFQGPEDIRFCPPYALRQFGDGFRLGMPDDLNEKHILFRQNARQSVQRRKPYARFAGVVPPLSRSNVQRPLLYCLKRRNPYQEHPVVAQDNPSSSKIFSTSRQKSISNCEGVVDRYGVERLIEGRGLGCDAGGDRDASSASCLQTNGSVRPWRSRSADPHAAMSHKLTLVIAGMLWTLLPSLNFTQTITITAERFSP